MSEESKDFTRKSNARPWGLLALTVALVFLGCAERTRSGDGKNVTSTAAASAASEKSTPAAEVGDAVELTPVDRAGYDSKLAKLHGKVVLVDFWATWCGPCLEQLPHTTALADERRGDGLTVVTVGMDDPDVA